MQQFIETVLGRIKGVSDALSARIEALEHRDPIHGKDGAPGRDGVDGKDGAPGRDGEKGADGRDGRDGIDGKDGGNGPCGDKGETGDRGEIGLTGPKGDQGEPGPVGDRGDKGEPGDRGEIGPTGPKGDTGEPGRDAVLPEALLKRLEEFERRQAEQVSSAEVLAAFTNLIRKEWPPMPPQQKVVKRVLRDAQGRIAGVEESRA